MCVCLYVCVCTLIYIYLCICVCFYIILEANVKRVMMQIVFFVDKCMYLALDSLKTALRQLKMALFCSLGAILGVILGLS